MEEFLQRLADAEKAVYGQRRGEEEPAARGGWRKGEEKTKEIWRKEEDGEDRDRWEKNERDSSPRERGRYHGGRGGEREWERYRGGDYERDRYREKERDRERERDRNGGRQRGCARDRDGEIGYKDEDRIINKEKDGNEDDDALDPSGQSRNRHSLSLGSLKGRFLKPSEDDDGGEGGFTSRHFPV